MPMIDNENLLDGTRVAESANEQNKLHELNLFIIQAAIFDSHNNLNSGLNELEDYFICIEDREKAEDLYKNFQKLCKIMTEKQFEVLELYMVNRWRLIDIAEELSIAPCTVLMRLKGVAKKIKKSNIKINLL